MGKTSKPLIIVALPPVSEWLELEKLKKQGHIVYKAGESGWNTIDHAKHLAEADVILGANCWFMNEDLRKYLALALKSARVLRYKDKEDRLDVGVAKDELDLGLDDSGVDGGETTGEDE